MIRPIRSNHCLDDFLSLDSSDSQFRDIRLSQGIKALHPVVSELHQVFKPYRLGDDFVGCEDCVRLSDTEFLKSQPLRQLHFADLNRYAFKAMTTWGNVRHFKYFLPRLLELSLEDLQGFDFPESLFGKLEYAEWKTWRGVERNAINEFLHHFWKHHLSRFDETKPSESISVLLGCLANTGISLVPFLDSWTKIPEQAAFLHLCTLIDLESNSILAEGKQGLLWGDPEQASRELIQWVASDSVQKYLFPYREEILVRYPFLFGQLDAIRSAYGPSSRD